jgi:N-acetylglucosaminyl-diphospho-decaprenol L-rhamnosyltransferase
MDKPCSAERNGDLDVTIIIVSYNTREMTVECIRSVLEQTSAIRYEVIVVDNASMDGSAEAIRTNFPNIKLLALAENLGFGRANNLAATHARGHRILLLNPDTVILDHAIDNLHEFALANPECRIWGGRTLFADGMLNPKSCWRRMTLWNVFCYATGLSLLKGSSLFNSEGYGGWKRDTVRAVDIVVGCFFLIDRDLWEELHGFDQVFFMYGEEADLCHRARQIGARPMITPTATIIHYGGASEADKTDKRIKLLAGKITLMRRHWSALPTSVGRLLYLIAPVIRLAVYGTLGSLLGRADFRRTAQTWREVWRSRQRWINGWEGH